MESLSSIPSIGKKGGIRERIKRKEKEEEEEGKKKERKEGRRGRRGRKGGEEGRRGRKEGRKEGNKMEGMERCLSGSQPSVLPVPEDPAPSDLHRQQT